MNEGSLTRATSKRDRRTVGRTVFPRGSRANFLCAPESPFEVLLQGAKTESLFDFQLLTDFQLCRKPHPNRLRGASKPQVLIVINPTRYRFLRWRASRPLETQVGGEEMKTKKNSTIVICLTAILAFSPIASVAQATTTFSGEAVALRANAVGISLSLADTGALPSSGGNLSTSLASVNVLGLASADALKSTSSGSGTSSQSQSSIANLSLLGGLVAADVVKSNSRATCSGSQASVSGNAELVGLVAAGQSIVVSNPNLAISLPGGISLIINEQTSSSGGNTGSMTVNALHVKGPSIDIVVASAQSGITCS